VRAAEYSTYTLPMKWGGVRHRGEGFVILGDLLEPDTQTAISTPDPGRTVALDYDFGVLPAIKTWCEDRSLNVAISVVCDMVGDDNKMTFTFNKNDDAALFKIFFG